MKLPTFGIEYPFITTADDSDTMTQKVVDLVGEALEAVKDNAEEEENAASGANITVPMLFRPDDSDSILAAYGKLPELLHAASRTANGFGFIMSSAMPITKSGIQSAVEKGLLTQETHGAEYLIGWQIRFVDWSRLEKFSTQQDEDGDPVSVYWWSELVSEQILSAMKDARQQIH